MLKLAKPPPGSGPSHAESRALSERKARGRAIVEDTLRSTGQPLDEPTRTFMEARLGHAFAGVRVHADADAARAAGAVGARAFAIGNHLVFARDRYTPQTAAGRRLLAHELAHVIQQGGGTADNWAFAEEPASAEIEAKAAERVVAGGRVRIGSTLTPRIQRAPDADTGVIKQFPDPGGLTRAQIEEGLLRMVDIIDTATSTTTALDDLEQFAMPRYVAAFVHLSHYYKQPPTIQGLDPNRPGDRRLLQLLPPQPLDQPNFLEPPKPAPPTTVPAQQPETPLEKFVREHARELQQLPAWNQAFAAGLKESALGAKLGGSWEQLRSNLTSADRGVQFYFGFVTGVPIGAVKDIYEQVKGVAELLLKAYLLDRKLQVDPQGALRDLRQFGASLGHRIVGLLDPGELGRAIGESLAQKIDADFVRKNPTEQGRFVGECLGMLLMEVALLFVGVEEVSAAAKALRGTRIGREVAEGMAGASRELKTILEARGALKSEEKLAGEAAKEAKGVESAAKETAPAAKPPDDPYDTKAWEKYYAENPQAKRSLGAAQADDPHAFTQGNGTNVPPDKPPVEVEARARGGAIERDHLDSMPDYSRPKEHDFPGIDAWKGGRDATRETNAGRMRIVSGADVLQVKSVGSSSPALIRARVREGISGLQPNVFEKGRTRVVNPASRRLDVLFEEGVLTEVSGETKSVLTGLSAEAGNSGIEVRWFRYSAGRKIRVPIP